MENWDYIKKKFKYNVGFYREETIITAETPEQRTSWNAIDSIFLQKLLSNDSSIDAPKNRKPNTTSAVLNETAISVKNSTNLSISSSKTSSTAFSKDKSQGTGILSTISVDFLTESKEILVDSSKHKNGASTTVSVEKSDYASLSSEISTTEIKNIEVENESVNTISVLEFELINEAKNGSETIPRGMHIAKVTTEHSKTTKEQEKIAQNENLSEIPTTKHERATPLFHRTSSLMNNPAESPRAVHQGDTIRSTTPGALTDAESTLQSVLPNTTSTELTEYDLATDDLSNVQKRYLVFSEHCRIPDIDPMDPSIAHLIEKTPPLDCSENHKPLTRTDGNVLYLNQTAALKRTAGDNYTCCYRSVLRENDGETDNDVGFGKKCMSISHQTAVKDEFISVECKYQNGSAFYQEFHSFIFDKPKVEERCHEANTSQYSILIIGVDAVSRLNMHRQLNATATYLLDEMGAIEMYGYNKVGDNTFPNLMPILTGYDERELPLVCWESKDFPLDKCNFLWKRYAEKGYRTLYAEDSPRMSSFNYAKRGFYQQPTDYYFHNFILAYEKALGRDKPLNCYKCVGSTSETEAVLHWTGLFASHFSNRPYFSFSWINSLTHDYLNMGSSADRMYETFFRSLHQTGALDKTVVILMSDHGMRWGSIRKTYVGRLEERLPMLMIALPQKFKQEYPEFVSMVKENSHRLVTPFDLHATLVHMLNLTGNWSIENVDGVSSKLSEDFRSRALSLFQPIPEDRSCDDAAIDEHWCTCETSLEADTKSNEVKRAAKFLLNQVNNLLKPVSDKCAILKLVSVSDARLWQPPEEHKGHSADDDIYTVVIHTHPGNAVFEGTVKISKPKIRKQLLGTISRLNLYGNQSSCVNDAIIKKYCYCL